VKLTKEDIPGASLEGRLPSQKIEEQNSGSMSWRLLQRTQNKAEYDKICTKRKDKIYTKRKEKQKGCVDQGVASLIKPIKYPEDGWSS
ncbi:unnamed protein product, partial [Pocillopora meandrina]